VNDEYERNKERGKEQTWTESKGNKKGKGERGKGKGKEVAIILPFSTVAFLTYMRETELSNKE
jgi:hypothetical protein